MKTNYQIKYFLSLRTALLATTLLGHDVPVHQIITQNAAASALTYSSSYKSFFDVVSSDISYDKAVAPMVLGSGFEDNRNVDENGNKDVGGARSLNHFYDPTKNPPVGLSDRGWPFSPALLGKPSFDWASVFNEPGIDVAFLGIPINVGTTNIWSWQNARYCEWLGLTATNQFVRQTNLAKMFRSVGQVVHLLEDTSQPQHVRNEQHLDQVLKMDLRSRSAIEDYGRDHSNSLNYAHSMLDWKSAGFTKLKDFWDRDFLRTGGRTALNADLSGGANTLGLAEFTSGNFIGQRAIYGELVSQGDIHHFAFPSLVDTTQPNLKEGHIWETAIHGDVTLANFKQGTRIYISKTNAGVLVTYHSALSYLIAEHPGKSGGLPVVTIADDNVLLNYHSIFIPKAVEYSAGMLDYYFRGTLSANVIGYNPGTSQFTNMVVNTSPCGQDFGPGTYYLFQDTNGIRSLLTSVTLNTNLPNTNSFAMTFPGSIPEPTNLVLVYQGTIGVTNGSTALDPVDAGIAIAAKSFTPWFAQTINYPDDYYAITNSGYSFTTNLVSQDFPFIPIKYSAIVNTAILDDLGSIGGTNAIPTYNPYYDGYGYPATITNVTIDPSQITVVGNHLSVSLSDTDVFGVYMGYQNVTITWQAWPTP
jgi:hypothetical protein